MGTTSARRRRWTAGVVGVLALAATAGGAQASPNDVGPRVRVATGTFSVTEFSIVPYQQLDNGAALNRFHASDVFQGDIKGTGSAEAQMLTRPDGTSNEAGLIHVVGSLHGRRGSFVIQTISSSDGNTARSSWTVLEGTGTGQLTGLKGRGSETAVNNGGSWSARYELNYYFG
ncbi:DUF3224 domain-containing protein [Micromonospora sp. KC723]|uniref:DUF3224 domain-containing protein n=1 Tax=Micromonospora sp. KC723 TaxID=2530381 RepID=UPI001048FBB4|nr:DUF3224 domain-containing protein [Micromonospora sp. KC723]TDB78124.1 DUF3224 domain-containing protein [Micromonospora sp. KC723]